MLSDDLLDELLLLVAQTVVTVAICACRGLVTGSRDELGSRCAANCLLAITLLLPASSLTLRSSRACSCGIGLLAE